MIERIRKGARAYAVLALLALIGGAATFSAFSSTTENTGNGFTTGSVTIADNDVGASMLSLSNARPNDSDTSCIKITYSGSLPSDVRLYATVTGSLAPYLQLKVIRGTESSATFDSCTNFTPDATDYNGNGAGVVYDGLLSAFPSSYASGLVDPTSGTPETWTSGEDHSYKFIVTLADNAAAQGLSSNAEFNWEARNQ